MGEERRGDKGKRGERTGGRTKSCVVCKKGKLWIGISQNSSSFSASSASSASANKTRRGTTAASASLQVQVQLATGTSGTRVTGVESTTLTGTPSLCTCVLFGLVLFVLVRSFDGLSSTTPRVGNWYPLNSPPGYCYYAMAYWGYIWILFTLLVWIN